MPAREIKPDVFFVGSVDWDRKLFDSLIPLPDGTSYNAYLIRGSEKTALLDAVDPSKLTELFENLDQLGVKKLDYVVAHHAEQDHSGTIPAVLEKFPGSKVVTNAKCKEFLMMHLPIAADRFVTVADGEALSLGNKTLEFALTPWVHWPETMVSYLKEDKILFTCDFFGSHLATNDLFVKDECKVYEAAKRYYAEIMMPFRIHIRNHLEKIKKYDFQIIAPSHGPLYDKPSFIIDAYKDWISDAVKNEVVLIYVSMHDSVGQMARWLMDDLTALGVTVKPFNLASADIGQIAIALVDAATVVVGSSTVNIGPHPLAVYGTYLFNILKPKTRYVSVIGSYAWGGKMLETLQGLLTQVKAEVLDPVIIKGRPQEPEKALLRKLAEAIAAKHAGLK